MRNRWHIAWLIWPMALAIGILAPQAEPRIGTVVQKTFNGAEGARITSTLEALYFGHDVFAEEKVSTPPAGSTVMRFGDQTQLQIGSNSTVVLDRFVYDPNSETADASIKFTKGVFRYIAGQAKNEEEIKLTTPTTTLTIRGTRFMVYVAADGGTIIQVLEGIVDIAPCGGHATVHAHSGQTFEASAACAGIVQVTSAAFPGDPAVEGDYSVASDGDSSTNSANDSNGHGAAGLADGSGSGGGSGSGDGNGSGSGSGSGDGSGSGSGDGNGSGDGDGSGDGSGAGDGSGGATGGDGDKPGNGYGDHNHHHSGPPGQNG